MASPQSIDRYLRSKGSPLAGYGTVFVEAGKHYGVDPGLLVAISGAESGFGKTLKGSYNPFGWGPGINFKSYPEAIDAIARGLKKGYLDQGLTSVQQIGSKWAPVGATNDPTNLNSNWTTNVNKLFREIKGGSLGTGEAIAPPPLPQSPQGAGPVPPSAPNPAALLDSLFASNNAMLGVDTPAGLTFAKPPKMTALAAPTGQTIPVVNKTGGPIPESANTIVAAAQKFLGTPYAWGGGGPGGPSKGFGRGAGTVGFDCSSLLQYAYAKVGKQIPRVTYDQWRTGTPVKPNALQPGDAVFFHPGSRGPEHVGIYVGDGKFMEAPKTGDVVKISSLSGRSDYMGARRW